MALIKIIPSPLSKKFSGIEGPVTQYEEIKEESGQVTVRGLGDYKRERFPNSVQGERPISFSATKRRFLVKDHTANSEELNDLVKRCNLINDITKHYDYNKPITTCDIFNAKDPFFNHGNLKINFSEGYGSLDTDNPLEYILYQGIMINNRFQIGGEVSNPALNGRAKYIVVDSTIDKLAKKQTRDKRKLAEKLVDNMSDDKKRSIAVAMGLVSTKDTDIDTIVNILEETALDSKHNITLKMSRQDMLIKLAEAPNEEIEARNYVTRAFKEGLIKRDKETNTYILFGIQIGKDKQAVISYLLSPINNETLVRLQKALDLND